MPREPQTRMAAAEDPARGNANRFVGKTAVITGANDRGIGGAIAERFAREGAAISILSIERPARLLERLSDTPAEVRYINCDVSQQNQVDAAIKETIQHFDGFDIVVNNAGIEMATRLTSLTDEAWQQLLDVNLTGVMRVTRAALGHLETRQGGVIVNIASVSGTAGTPGLSAYAATKAGVIGMTMTLAQELATKKIRVVAIAPALVKTPMATQFVADMTEEVWNQVQACHPLGIGSPSDVASAVAFLASDEAKWITGVTLPMGWMPTYPLPFDQYNESEPQ